MTKPRIFSPESLQNASVCQLGIENLRYLKTVLRLKAGDAVRVFDGFGHEFEGRIESFTETGVMVPLQAMIDQPEKSIRITLAQAIPKAAKMDAIVKTAAELGADEIIPFEAMRSVSRLDARKAELRVARWQKIVQEAARCARSTGVADILPVMSFPEMLVKASPLALKMIFWEEESQRSIRDVLTGPVAEGVSHYFIIIGPEGGLTRDEVFRAGEAGFLSVSLGHQILKVETAGAAILAIIQYEKGIFSQKAGGVL